MENAEQIIDVSDIIMYKVSSFLLIFIFMKRGSAQKTLLLLRKARNMKKGRENGNEA